MMFSKGKNMYLDNRVTGRTKIIGIIGNPIEHSFSPQLHNTISSYLNVDLVYVPFKVEKNDLEKAVKGLKALNLVGFNVTIPFKKDIMKYIDDNTKEALLMGAVNTVKNIDGRFYGYNTDAEGFSRSFKEESGVGFKDKKVAIIGAGGVSRAIAVKVAIEGAKKIAVLNRTESKASELSEVINNNISKVSAGYGLDDKKAPEILKDCDIVINTTSSGMYPDILNCPLNDTFQFETGQIVYDAIYNPIKTSLLQRADEKGCITINGLGMLFYQGINAYEIWTGIKLKEEKIKEIYKSFIALLGNK